jgi:hypothetical protein
VNADATVIAFAIAIATTIGMAFGCVGTVTAVAKP